VSLLQHNLSHFRDLVTIRRAHSSYIRGASVFPIGFVAYLNNRTGLTLVELDPDFVRTVGNNFVVRNSRGVEVVWCITELMDVTDIAAGDSVWIVDRGEFYLGHVVPDNSTDAGGVRRRRSSLSLPSADRIVCRFPALDAAEMYIGCILIGCRDFEAHSVAVAGIVVEQMTSIVNGEVLLSVQGIPTDMLRSSEGGYRPGNRIRPFGWGLDDEPRRHVRIAGELSQWELA